MIKVQHKTTIENRISGNTRERIVHSLYDTVKLIFPDLPELANAWTTPKYQGVSFDWVYRGSTTWHQGTPVGIMLNAYAPVTYRKIQRRVMFKGSMPNEELDEAKVREKHQELIGLIGTAQAETDRIQDNRRLNEQRLGLLRTDVGIDDFDPHIELRSNYPDSSTERYNLTLKNLTPEQVKDIVAACKKSV